MDLGFRVQRFREGLRHPEDRRVLWGFARLRRHFRAEGIYVSYKNQRRDHRGVSIEFMQAGYTSAETPRCETKRIMGGPADATWRIPQIGHNQPWRCLPARLDAVAVAGRDDLCSEKIYLDLPSTNTNTRGHGLRTAIIGMQAIVGGIWEAKAKPRGKWPKHPLTVCQRSWE